MTIASTSNRADYTGTGSAGPFPFNYRVFAATDLVVLPGQQVVAQRVHTTYADALSKI